MKLAIFDVDGTLVDSEKLWDISIHQLYERFGSSMSPEVRESTVGGSSEDVIRIVPEHRFNLLAPAHCHGAVLLRNSPPPPAPRRVGVAKCEYPMESASARARGHSRAESLTS